MAHSLKRIKPSKSEKAQAIEVPTEEKPVEGVDENAADKKADELDAAFEGVDVGEGGDLEDNVQKVVEQTQTQTHAVAPAPANQHPAMSDGTDGQLQGGFDSSDIKMPAIKVVQGSSPLKEEFHEGTVVLGENLLLEPPPLKDGPLNKFRFVPFMMKKQYRQNLSQEEMDDGDMPAIVDSIEEVHAAGGTTQWMGRQKPSWGPLGTVTMLVEQPEGSDDPMFSLELDGKNFAVASYMAGGSAYTHCPKTILNNALSMLLEPMLDASGKPVLTKTGQPRKRPVLYRAFWTFHITRVKVRDFLIFQPRCKLLLNELVGPEARRYCEDLLARSV
jgi:hypothetical protein